MIKLPIPVLIAVALMSISLGCHSAPRSTSDTKAMPAVHYLEIVTNDEDALVLFHQRVHGLSFGPPDPDLGQARVAVRADGSMVGIRKPLAAHEQPIMRTYLAVPDIQKAVKAAEENGGTTAYPPTRQGQRGTFAIVFAGDVQHGFWQRD